MDSGAGEHSAELGDLFHALPTATLVLDADEAVVVEANGAAARLLRVPRERIVGAPLPFASSDAEAAESVRRRFGGGRPFQARGRLAIERDEIDVDISANPIVFGGSPACVVTLVRVADAGNELPQAVEATLAGLVLAAHEAVITVDDELRITSVNPAALAMFRVTEEEAVGRSIEHFIPRPYRDEYGARLLAFGLSGPLVRPLSTELLLVRGDGEVFVGAAGVARANVNGERFIGIIIRDVTVQRQMESSLLDSERRFQLITSVAPVGIVRTDSEGLCIYMNDEALAIVGRSSEQALGRAWQGFVHPDDVLVYGPSWNDAVAHARPIDAEYRVVRPDGEERWVLARARAELDEDGEVRSYTGAFSDITERRQADERLARSRELLGALIDASPLGILILQADGTLVRFNEAARQFLGLESPSAGVGEYNVLTDPLSRAIGSAALVEPAFRGEVVEVFGRRVNFDVPENRRGIARETRVIDELVFPITGPNREIRAVIVFIHDVTEHHLAEQAASAAIREAEHLFRNALNSVAEGFILFDRDLRVISWNRFMEEATGRGASEVVGLPPAEALPEIAEDSLVPFLRRALAGETVMVPDSLYLRPGSEKRTWLSGSLSPWRDASGEINGVVAVAQDITARKRNEDALRNAEKLESLSVLAAGIAHDFTNLFGTILGNAEIALMDLAADSPTRPVVREIIAATQRAAELSAQMLAYAGKAGVAPQPLDIGEMVADTAMRVARAAGRSDDLQLDIEAGLPPLPADLAQVRIAVTALLTNAFEALPADGGRVRMTVSLHHLTPAELRRTYLAPRRDGGRFIRIEVRDNGHGMDEETLRRAFDPFWSTRFTSRGLGLPAVLGIVRGHAGAIDVRSTRGQGTTATIYFPVP
ncbi:MAG: PAS domain S-box protein [Dehalococcoidia bacterium]|nr:PAS domain S-box protein [Dehalococcoidia bacterium]